MQRTGPDGAKSFKPFRHQRLSDSAGSGLGILAVPFQKGINTPWKEAAGPEGCLSAEVLPAIGP